MTDELREQFRMSLHNFQNNLNSGPTPTMPGGLAEEIALDEFDLILNKTDFHEIVFMHDKGY